MVTAGLSQVEDREIEVAAKAKRRTFTADYKRNVLQEADACSKSGEIGALLRREGLYSSNLVEWRKARDRGELRPGRRTKARGPVARQPDARDKQLVELGREIRKLKARAERAEKMLEIQKKLAQLLDERYPPDSDETP